MKRKPPAKRKLIHEGYHAPAGYPLDLEIFPSGELLQRQSVDYLRIPKRIDFHLLVYVTAGRCTHITDFEPVACKPGSMLVLRPGQVQRFDVDAQWRGWVMLFRPEFLHPQTNTAHIDELEIFRQLEELPEHLTLSQRERSAVTEHINRMYSDAGLDASAGARHALLRYQLHALLARLHLAQVRCENEQPIDPALLKRFKRFRIAVEHGFQQRHRIADYAKLLGCSEKSLTRATLEVAGCSAKVYLSRRIALEAKRLLIHTALPVSGIADRLGFDEATNFIKFFRREAGCTPGDFRERKHA